MYISVFTYTSAYYVYSPHFPRAAALDIINISCLLLVQNSDRERGGTCRLSELKESCVTMWWIMYENIVDRIYL